MQKTITIVTFNAFARPNTIPFIDLKPEEIHDHLERICNTYEPLSIYHAQVTKEEYLPLNTLTKFKTDPNHE